MRRVKTDELDGNGAAPPIAGDVDLGASLNRMLAGLKDLQTMQKSIEGINKEIHSMWGRINAAEKVGNEKMARRNYESIAHISGAGADLPGLDEARKYVETSEDEDR